MDYHKVVKGKKGKLKKKHNNSIVEMSKSRYMVHVTFNKVLYNTRFL